MNRAGAWALLTEFTQSDSLRKHALAVEASMRAYADRYRADPEAWGWRACSTTSTTRCIPRRRIIP